MPIEFNQLLNDIRDKKITTVNHSGISDTEVTQLAAVLPGSNVTELCFWNGHIGAGGAAALAQALPASNVINLLLGGNPIGDCGVTALAAALPQSRITLLDLINTGMGSLGAGALADALPNSKVTNLLLGNNNIGSDGTKSLASALPKSSVQSLYLGNNHIESDGAAALVDGVKYSGVSALNIGRNNIGDEQAIKLVSSGALQRLDISDNNVSEGSIAKCREIIAQPSYWFHPEWYSAGTDIPVEKDTARGTIIFLGALLHSNVGIIGAGIDDMVCDCLSWLQDGQNGMALTA